MKLRYKAKYGSCVTIEDVTGRSDSDWPSKLMTIKQERRNMLIYNVLDLYTTDEVPGFRLIVEETFNEKKIYTLVPDLSVFPVFALRYNVFNGKRQLRGSSVYYEKFRKMMRLYFMNRLHCAEKMGRMLSFPVEKTLHDRLVALSQKLDTDALFAVPKIYDSWTDYVNQPGMIKYTKLSPDGIAGLTNEEVYGTLVNVCESVYSDRTYFKYGKTGTSVYIYGQNGHLSGSVDFGKWALQNACFSKLVAEEAEEKQRMFGLCESAVM